MRVLVVGPLVMDTVIVGEDVSHLVGGAPYYIAQVFKQLGHKVHVVLSYAPSETSKVEKAFAGMRVHPVSMKKTIAFRLRYDPANPDVPLERGLSEKYVPNVITAEHLPNEHFDYIILGPTFQDNIHETVFSRKDPLVLGTMGMFWIPRGKTHTIGHPSFFDSMLSSLEYFIVNEHELQQITGEQDLDAGVAWLRQHGAQKIVITRGTKGSSVFTKNRTDIPAFPAQLVDPTGAGDSFMAAFVAAHELFSSDYDRASFAAMVSSMTIQQHGAFSGSLEDVLVAVDRVRSR